MRHTIQVLVENKFGVLARIASLFSARGYNIESLAVGETQDEQVSCMTIVVNAEDETILEQIKKQLNKLIDVITVVDFLRREYIDRDLFLIRVKKQPENQQKLKNLTNKLPMKIIHQDQSSYIVEASLDRHQEEEVLKELGAIGIKELVRTGRIAMKK